MLTITAIKSKAADGGAGGVPAYLTATEYYVDRKGKERSSSAWFGKGAEALGLVGKPVSIELMDKLARGFAPDGTPLRQNAGATPQVRPVMDRQGKQRLDENGKPMTATVGVRVGTDLTFSAPKTVSICFAGADPALRDKILSAHHAAVEKGLAFMEKHAAETRRGKGGKNVIGAELLVSRHTHYGSRPHEKDWKQRGDHRLEVDAQLHTHALVYNVARGDDGQWGTIEPREMYRWKMTVGALYRAELAAGLQRLGFGIEDDIRLDQDGQVKDRFFKIAGIPDDLAEEMSGRRKQILAHMEAHGGTAQQANFATRNSKDEPSFPELLDRWHADLADYRARHPGSMPDKLSDLLDHGPRKAPEIDQAKLDRELLTELHETKSVWTRADLTEKIAVRLVGRLDAQGVLREASAFLVRNDLEIIDPERIHKEDEGKKLSRRHTEVRFAEPKVVEQERQLVQAAVARKYEQEIRLDPRIVAAAIADMEAERGFKLSAEQRGAVEFATMGSGGVALVQGWAGSGKTTAAEATVKAFRASGREVIGCSTGWDAAKKLESEAGIPSHSIASLVSKLEKGKIKLTEKSVILIDEAGMVGTPSLAALMEHAHRARAKIIGQGDVLQLQSVERGAPMRAMAEAIGSATLKDIRRQRSGLDKDTADLYYAAGGTELRSRRQNQQAGEVIMARMEARGQLVGLDDIAQAQKTLVQDYAASKLPARDKLVLASTREDVDALNRAIRDVRRARGELGIEHTVPTTNPRSGQVQTIAVAEHDRIRFTKKSEELGVVNGSKAVVTGLVPHPDGSFTVRATIESDIKKGQDGRKIEFKTKDASITHGYASTVHKAQGQSVEEVFHLGHRGMTDRQLSLVSFTRMKSSYALYGVASELFDRSGDAAHATDRLQTNALQEGLSRKFAGRTTTQVMADIAKEKALHATEKAVAPASQTPKAKRLAKASAAIKQASPKVKAKQRPPVQTSPEQASLVQRAAMAFKTVASRMRQAVLARQREVEQQVAQQRKRTRSMSR